MTIELIKALMVGVIAALPVGPVLLMVIQKTLRGGKTAGMMTGLGSAVGDSFLAAVGPFAFGAIQDFISRFSGIIMMVGGVLLAIIGLVMARKKSIPAESSELVAVRDTGSMISYPIQSMLGVFSNPAAYAVMFGLLGMMGLGGDERMIPAWLVLLCVACGELLYWSLVVFVLSKFIRLSSRSIHVMNVVAGVAICCFAVFVFVKGVLTL